MSQNEADTQTEIVKKKQGRTKIYTAEEALQLKRERNRAYQKKRYQEDPEFRQRKIDNATRNNPAQYEKLKQKLQKLKDLEAMIELNKN